MGQFIDTQQGLLTEQKQKRLEREQKQKDKKRQETQELELFFTLDNILYNEPEEKKERKFKQLHTPKQRDYIINLVTNYGDIKDIYILTKKYNTILNNVYNAYKLNDKDITKAEAETIKKLELKLFRTLKNTMDFKEYHAKSQSYYFKNNQEAYEFLTAPKNKDYIINLISKGNLESIYYLNKKYITILNNIYKPYKTTQKQVSTVKQASTTQTGKTSNGGAFLGFIAVLAGILAAAIKIFGYFIILPLLLIFKKRR